jgi:dehydrogenase/reductase SDR family protein 7
MISIADALVLHAVEGGLLLLVAVVLFAAWYMTVDADLSVLAAVRRMPHNAFEKKVVWVTGASSGIGEALAYELAGRGAALVLSARRMDRLLAVAQKCGELGAADAYALRLDVEALASHAPAAAHVLARFGRVGFLVNNAGRSQRGLIENTPVAVDAAMIALNVVAPISLTKAVLPAMLAAGAGAVVNTVSVSGKLGAPCSATYSATKHALLGWADALRAEVGSRGLHVVNVCPGPVQSEIAENAFCEDASGKPLGEPTEPDVHRLPAARCALLMAGAMHARLPEVWLAPQPILLFTYIAQFLPSFYHAISPVVGARRVAAFRNGSKGYGSIQSPVSMLRSWLFSKSA